FFVRNDFIIIFFFLIIYQISIPLTIPPIVNIIIRLFTFVSTFLSIPYFALIGATMFMTIQSINTKCCALVAFLAIRRSIILFHVFLFHVFFYGSNSAVYSA